MVDELEHLTLASVLFPSFVAFLAFLVRYSVRREFVGLLTFILDVFATLFVGVMVSFLIADYDMGTGTKWFVIALSAIVGPDLIAGVVQTGMMFSRTPVTLTLRIVRILTGKPLSKGEVKDMTEWELELRRNKVKGDVKVKKHRDE